VKERVGGGVLPPTAERDWPRMDPPNVLWFSGAIATAFAVNVLLDAISGAHNGLWQFLTAVGFILGFAAAAWFLLQRWWWVPGGLAAALAVASFPGVAIGFLKLVDVWPDDPFFDPLNDFSGWPFAVAITTAAVGLGAFLLTRFSFILAVVATAILVAAQILAPAFESPPSGEDRAAVALVFGAALVVVGIFLDAFGRRRDAFWFHVLGWFGGAAGLVFFTVDPTGDTDRGWIPMLIVGTLLLLLSGPVRRATWAVYGALGYYAAVLHYLINATDEDHWPFALWLLVLALSIFLMGMVLHRYGEPLGRRFVRRPPPTPPPPL
jgi:hypothetical protein